MEKLIAIGDKSNIYVGPNHILAREYGKTPNDNDMNGRWVLRTKNGELVDFDFNRNDIAERNNIKLEGNAD